MRLSCAAVLCSSQTQFYYDGRRQLQPLVRLRSEDRRSDPALYRSLGEHSPRPPLHRRCDAFWNDARIHRRTPAPALDETFIRKAHRGTRTHPSDAAAGWKLTRWGSQQNAVAVCLDAQPNGVRLSCAAVLWFSQLQFYYDGRRQLQPLVRLRTDNRRSHPARNRGHRSTHRVPPRTAAVTPTRAMLGFTSDRRPRRPTRLSSTRSIEELGARPSDAAAG